MSSGSVGTSDGSLLIVHFVGAKHVWDAFVKCLCSLVDFGG